MNITMTNRRPSAFTVIGEIADLVEVDGVLPGRLIACGLRGMMRSISFRPSWC